MIRRACSVAVIALTVTAVSTAAEVKVGFDGERDFSTYETYSWREGTPAARPEIQEWIVAAVDGELQSAGLRKVKQGGDVEVSTVAFAEWKNALRGDSVRLDSYTSWPVATADVANLMTGNLVVELSHEDTDSVVWRAIGKDAVDDGKMKKIESKVNKIVKKMFKGFPPEWEK